MTKSLELQSYYQRDWANALPSLPAGTLETGRHIVGLALPFMGILYQPAGRLISYTSTVLNALSSGIEVYSAKSFQKQHVWNIIKNGAELIGTLAGLRIGLGLHTVMNLGENLQKIVQTKEKVTLIPILSNGLYLLTLLEISKKTRYALMAGSLLVQAGVAFYNAQEAQTKRKGWKDIRLLDTVAFSALCGIFLVKAYRCFEQFQKLQYAVQRIFVLMRPASKQNKEHGGLSEKGQALAKTKMAPALEQIRDRNGQKEILLITSPNLHHRATALILTFKLNLDIWTESDLRERTRTGWQLLSKEAKKQDPDYQHFHQLSPEEQWVTKPDPKDDRSESPAELASRLDNALQKTFKKVSDPNQMAVFVSGGTIIGDYLKAADLPKEAQKRLHDGEMVVLKEKTDENGNKTVSYVSRVRP